jgi:hypothetical protein
MAAKKRIPPRPTPPAPKPPLKPSQRKDGKVGPKPGSGGFGRAEDQITRAIGSSINTAGKGIRSVATGVDKAVSGIGKAISSAYSNGGAPAGSFASSKPTPAKRPVRGPGGSRPQGGRLAKVESKRDPREAMQPRGDKRKKPTPRPVRGGGSKPKLPPTM